MHDSSAPSVLVADAEPYICRVFEAKLTKEGRFRVHCATSGLEAYRLALQQTFDVLLWDLRLRDSDMLLPLLCALCPAATIVAMSTDDQPVVSASLARLDIVKVLVKPFGLDTLEVTLRNLLDVRLPPRPLYFRIGSIGQSLTLSSPGGECITRILEAQQDAFTVVGAPRAAVPADFSVGMSVRVAFTGLDALYVFDSCLLASVEQPVPGWRLAMPKMVKRMQRREQPRIPYHKPLSLQRSDDLAATPLEGVTTNLSLSGLALISTEFLPPGTPLHFTLDHTLPGSGCVVWCQKEAANNAPQYRTGLRFDAEAGPDAAILDSLLAKKERLW